MKTLRNILSFGLVALTFTACSDVADEITELTLGRNMSPLDIEAKNVNETTANILWTATTGATSYNIEVFADDSLTFAGTPEQTLKSEKSSIALSGLNYDTKYSVRVQSISEDPSRDSKWHGVYFKTSAKQFLKNPKPADIADRQVTLKWETEEGYDVSTIVIGDITHQITAEEKAASEATITGLTPETDYTAYLYYNGKQCGNRSFTTIADLAGAILVTPEDDLKKLIEGTEENPVADGTVFALYGGTYRLNAQYDEETGELISTGAAKVTKSITIKGIYPTDQPIIKGRFEIYDGAGLSLSQVVLTGADNGTTDQMFNYKLDAAAAGVTFKPLDIQNCTITGLKDGKGLIYLNVEAIVEKININNSIVYGIECSGGDFIDSRKGLPREINLTNSTFYDVAAERDFIRVDDASASFAGEAGTVVTVDHCTLNNVGGNGANYRLLYVRFAGNKLIFTNNVVVGTTYKRGFTNQSKSDQEPTLDNNFYFDCQNLTSPGTGVDDSIVWFDTDSSAYDKVTETGTVARGKGNGTVLSSTPFQNASPDFTLKADSQPYTKKAGDPRWIVAQ